VTHTLTIEIDEKTNEIRVVHGDKTYFLESLAIFGGNAKTKELFIKMFGSSADAAWAYGQGFRIAHSPEGGKALKNFYKQSAAHVCNIIDPNAFQNEIGGKEAVNMWENPDQRDWFAMDSEDVLRDKQLSEAEREKKKWN